MNNVFSTGDDHQLSINIFNTSSITILNDLNSLSSTKINNIGKLCIKYIKYYKHIVHNIEKWSKKSINQQQYVLFIIDSIIKHGSKLTDDIYAERFGINLFNTLEHINELKYDMKLLAYRIIQSWIDKKLFSEKILNSISTITNSLRIEVEKHGDKEKIKDKDKSKTDNKSSTSKPISQSSQPAPIQPLPYASTNQPLPPASYINPYDPYYSQPPPPYPNEYDKYNNRDYQYDNYSSHDPSRRNYHEHDPSYRYEHDYRDHHDRGGHSDRGNSHYDYRRSSDTRRHGSPDRQPSYDPRNQDYAAPLPSYDRSYRERDHERDINRYTEPLPAPVIQKPPSNTAPPPASALNLPDLSALLSLPATTFGTFPPVSANTQEQSILGKTDTVVPAAAFEFDYGDDDDEYLNRKPRPAPTFSSTPAIAKMDETSASATSTDPYLNKSEIDFASNIHPDRANVHPDRLNVHPDRLVQDRNSNFGNLPVLPSGYSQNNGFQNQHQNFPKGNLAKLDGMIMMQDQTYSPPGFTLSMFVYILILKF